MRFYFYFLRCIRETKTLASMNTMTPQRFSKNEQYNHSNQSHQPITSTSQINQSHQPIKSSNHINQSHPPITSTNQEEQRIAELRIAVAAENEVAAQRMVAVKAAKEAEEERERSKRMAAEANAENARLKEVTKKKNYWTAEAVMLVDDLQRNSFEN